MGFINKEKVLRGIGKAVDVTNEAADKVSVYVKEKELDKKALNAANEVGDAMKSAISCLNYPINNWEMWL